MKKLGIVLAACLTAAVLVPYTVSAESYIYTRSGEAVPSPAVYSVKKQVELAADGLAASSPQDVFRAESGELYVADTNNNRILIFDRSLESVRSLSRFIAPDGGTETLNAPEGVFVSGDNILYIADTQNHRIIVSDLNGNLLRIIDKPEGLTGVSEEAAFNPIKLVADSSGRIYVVARNYNLGILQLDAAGEFVGYIGAPKVQYSLIQMLWRKISTEKQLSQMEQYVPTEYNNIAIDSEDFIYGTIGTLDADKLKAVIESKDTSGTVTPIKKLNTTGSDVLKRNGAYPPVGDLEYDDQPSRIVDAAYGRDGVYALLDVTAGHIFLYDDNGNLFGVLGGYGNEKNDFRQVSSLAFSGDDLIVLDAGAARLTVFELTAYGERLMSAVSAQFNGDFDLAYELWSGIAEQNRNFEYAFVGLGQSYMSSGKYKEAMECFQYANDKENYSEAKSLQRKDAMKTAFPVIFVALIGLFVLYFVFRISRRVYRYVRGYGYAERP